MAVKVLVVDDSGFFRRRVSEILSADPNIQVVGTATNGKEAIDQALALKPEPVDISPEIRLSIIETLISIDALLDDLGSRTREIFLAVQLEGLTYVAVAERFEVSVTTVKNHLIRAMTRCLLLVEN